MPNIGSYYGNLKEKRGSSFKVKEFDTAPASASSAGEEGEVRITADYIYVCSATDTWVRAALTTWT